MDIRSVDISEQKTLEDFLISNFSEKARKLAQSYIKCMFSNDYRRPTFLIASENDEILGALAYSEELFTTNMWGISWVCVRESDRRKGVGEKLVSACLEEISKHVQNKATVILCSYPNISGLYEKTGFTFIGNDHAGGRLMTQYLEKTS